MIRLEHLNVTYRGGTRALCDINLEIAPGELVFLVGPSGAGKSSLIKTILREVNSTSGKIYIDGEDVTRLHKRRIPYLRRKVGVVFQDFRLLPQKTVFENIAYAMEITGASKKSIRKNVPIILSLVNLEGKEDVYPPHLSGGEQQRVSIARSMVNSPRVLIADEPTGNLDPANSAEIMKLLLSFNRRGTTIIIATHDRELVDATRRRVIAMRGGQIVRDQMRGGYGNDI